MVELLPNEQDPASNSDANDGTGGSGILYFGYGAMVNPISRARRGVQTHNERPAVLEDFRLTFAYGGAGNILRKRGWSVHGVVMECKTTNDWKLLKEFDAGYDCMEVDVYPYDSEEPVRAHIFVMDWNEAENARLPTEKLPQERYVKVIATGMRHHGVDDEYIDYSILNVPYIPNRKPGEYLSFPHKVVGRGKAKTYSYDEYVRKANKKAWFLIGNRVIQLGDHDPHSPFVEWMTDRLIGKPDCTWTMLQTLYDPDLPLCECKEDIQSLHVEWAENQLVEKFEQADLTAMSVGIVSPETKRTSFGFGSGCRVMSGSLRNFAIKR